MFAQFQIIGRATRDTESTFTQSGKQKATISLATNNGDNTYYYNITAFDSLAELVTKYVKKGKQIFVEGNIEPKSYEKDGQKVYITNFTARKVEFLGGSSQEQPKDERELPF